MREQKNNYLPSDSPALSAENFQLEIKKLRKINKVLVDRVERSMDQQGHGFSLFQTAINLETQIDRRTSELTATLAHLNRTNHELETAKNLAEKSNLNKSQVLAAASHDVLQPLNAALLLISSLNSLQTCDEGQRLCGQIERSLDTMTELLNSLLYMSRLDAGAVQPEWQSVSLLSMFSSIESDFQPIAQAKSIELRIRHNNLFVHSDPTMLRRIVQNIVANAIEYTSEGGVLVSANRIGEQVHIRVADTGCGIDRESFDSIFKEFYRGSLGNSAKQQHSAGLGLAIVSRMVETLNHSIAVNSIIDSGSCFRLSLLAAECVHTNLATTPTIVKSDSAPHTGKGFEGARILFVENDFVVLNAMDNLFKQWGCEYRLASSTQEALSSVANTRWKPELVLADQHLDAEETGTSTIDLIRTLIGEQVPAVIITANPSKQLSQTAEAANIEIMHKPVKPAQLRALIAHHLIQRKPSNSDLAS